MHKVIIYSGITLARLTAATDTPSNVVSIDVVDKKNGGKVLVDIQTSDDADSDVKLITCLAYLFPPSKAMCKSFNNC